MTHIFFVNKSKIIINTMNIGYDARNKKPDIRNSKKLQCNLHFNNLVIRCSSSYNRIEEIQQ